LLQAIQAAPSVEWNATVLREVARGIREATYQGATGTLRWAANGDLAASPYAVYVTRRGGRILGWFDPLPIPRAAPGR
jgi:ABC-type branched-subunit amino acid transport system substrate-binding protein